MYSHITPKRVNVLFVTELVTPIIVCTIFSHVLSNIPYTQSRVIFLKLLSISGENAVDDVAVMEWDSSVLLE